MLALNENEFLLKKICPSKQINPFYSFRYYLFININNKIGKVLVLIPYSNSWFHKVKLLNF